MGVAQGVISLEQAKEYGWLITIHRLNKFLERYNESQENGVIFSCLSKEELPEYLKGANFKSANLESAIIIGGDLEDANLEDANLKDTVIVNVDLEGANLTGSNFTDAYVRGVSLVGADLIDANLTDANFTGSDLDDVDFTGANLTDAKIDISSLLEETEKWNNVDFTRTRLKQDGKLLNPELSREIIINRMIELKITDAKGLGDDYQAALVDAGLFSVPLNEPISPI